MSAVRPSKENSHASYRLRTLITAFAIASASLAAQAQTTTPLPPIKPGLWQVHIEREVNGQKMPDASERMKNMPPEKRAQFEAMMKSAWGRMGGAGNQVCYTREIARAFTLGGCSD